MVEFEISFTAAFAIAIVGITDDRLLTTLDAHCLEGVMTVFVINLQDKPRQTSEEPRTVADRNVGSEPRHEIAAAPVTYGFLALVTKNRLGIACKRPLLGWILTDQIAVLTLKAMWHGMVFCGFLPFNINISILYLVPIVTSFAVNGMRTGNTVGMRMAQFPCLQDFFLMLLSLTDKLTAALGHFRADFQHPQVDIRILVAERVGIQRIINPHVTCINDCFFSQSVAAQNQDRCFFLLCPPLTNGGCEEDKE